MSERHSPIRLIAAFLLLLAVLVFGVASVWSHHPPDLSALYMAGHLYATGQYDLVYAAPAGFFGGTPPEWIARIAGAGFTHDMVLPYVYPPLWSALLAPLTEIIGPAAFFRAGAILMAGLIGGSVLLAWRMARAFAVPLWAWILISCPILATSAMVQMALFQLQPHIIVVFLMLLAFERHGAGHFAAAGIALGLAIALKLSPAPLILIFLVNRDWPAAGWCALTVLVCAAASLLVCGIDMHHDFLASVSAAAAGSQITGTTFSAEVLLDGLAAIAGLSAPLDLSAYNIRIEETPVVLALAGKALLVCGLVLTFRATAPLDDARRRVAQFFLVALLLYFFGPLGWSFYFLPQIFLLPALIGLLPVRTGTALVVAAASLTSWPLFIGISLAFDGDYIRAGFGAAVLLALFAAVLSGILRHRSPRQTLHKAMLPRMA